MRFCVFWSTLVQSEATWQLPRSSIFLFVGHVDSEEPCGGSVHVRKRPYLVAALLGVRVFNPKIQRPAFIKTRFFYSFLFPSVCSIRLQLTACII